MDYPLLSTVLKTHPTWPSVTDSALTTWVNEAVISQDVSHIAAEEVYEAIVPSEFAALSADAKSEVWNILILHANSGVPTKTGARARTRLVTLFGAGSVTIGTNLAPKTTRLVSRAANAGILEVVREGDVQYARTL